MRSLGLDGLSIRCDELTRHHTQTSKALCEDIRLHVSVVVLASPDEPAGRLDRLRDHIVNQTMLVIDGRFIEEGFVVAFYLINLMMKMIRTSWRERRKDEGHTNRKDLGRYL